MSKNNNVRFSIQRKSRGVKTAFNRFKDAIDNIKIFNSDGEQLIKLTLDNLLNEIKTATKIVKEGGKK